MTATYRDAMGETVDISDYVHEVSGGRFVVAEWKERAGQWHAPMTEDARQSTGAHTVFGPSLDSIASSPNVYIYARRSKTIEAAINVYGLEVAS